MSSDIAAQVIARETERCNALLAADLDALDALLSERLVFAHATSHTEDKASLLTKMASGNIVYHTLQVTEQRVIELDDTALLLSRLTADVSVGGAPRAIDNRTLSVWTREAGQWRLIAYQPTAIPR